MKSLLQTLAIWDIEPPFRVPSGFQTHPNSLREIVRILNLPDPRFRAMEYRRVHEFTENDAQGLTHAYGNIWFLSSEKRVFKYSVIGPHLNSPTFEELDTRTLSQLVAEAGLDEDDFDHIGDLCYFDGLLFAPLRHQSRRPPHLLLALSESLEVVGYSRLSKNTNDAWCTINPWNGLLYAPPSDSAEHLHVYDPSEFYEILPHRNRWGRRVNLVLLDDRRFFFYRKDGSPDQVRNIQGVAFSRNGRLYVARYDGDGPWENYLRVYNALTGVRLDVSPEYNFDGIGDEIEGLSIHPTGVIYVAVAEDDSFFPGDDDEFDIYAFKYRDPSHPV